MTDLGMTEFMETEKDLVATAYVSSASHPFSEEDLERLLESSGEFNAANEVTGLLLYDEGNFFQIIEGTEDAVQRTYDRITASAHHHGIVQLFYSPVKERNFKDWSMGFTHAPKSKLLQLAQASWGGTLDENVDRENVDDGMRLLLEFWLLAKGR